MAQLLHSRSKGIALFQVLLITAVISILAVQFTQTARNQISVASTIVDRIEAQVILRTTESELLFNLLTENRERKPSAINRFTNSWNFHGEPFYIDIDNQELRGSSSKDSISITIQDLNALVGLYQDGRPQLFSKLIRSVVSEPDNDLMKQDLMPVLEESPSVLVNSLIDWQDRDSNIRINGAESGFYNQKGMPSNVAVQTYQEIQYVRGFNAELLRQLGPYVTIRPQSYFNPMQSPARVLSLMVSKERVAEIVRLRQLGELTTSKFSTLSGLSIDEGMSFSTSGILRIEVLIQVGEVSLKKQIELKVQPYDTLPYLEYEHKA